MIKGQLIAGTISSLVATMIYTDLFPGKDYFLPTTIIPSWLLVLIISINVFLICILVYQSYTKPKLVFIALSQFSNKKFFASLVNDLINHLALSDIQVVVMSPSAPLSEESERKLFNKILKRKSYFIGCLVITAKTEDKDDNLLKLIEKFNKPVLFIDAPVPLKAEEYPDNSAFIGYNNNKGDGMDASLPTGEPG